MSLLDVHPLPILDLSRACMSSLSLSQRIQILPGTQSSVCNNCAILLISRSDQTSGVRRQRSKRRRTEDGEAERRGLVCGIPCVCFELKADKKRKNRRVEQRSLRQAGGKRVPEQKADRNEKSYKRGSGRDVEFGAANVETRGDIEKSWLRIT